MGGGVGDPPRNEPAAPTAAATIGSTLKVRRCRRRRARVPGVGGGALPILSSGGASSAKKLLLLSLCPLQSAAASTAPATRYSRQTRVRNGCWGAEGGRRRVADALVVDAGDAPSCHTLTGRRARRARTSLLQREKQQQKQVRATGGRATAAEMLCTAHTPSTQRCRRTLLGALDRCEGRGKGQTDSLTSAHPPVPSISPGGARAASPRRPPAPRQQGPAAPLLPCSSSPAAPPQLPLSLPPPPLLQPSTLAASRPRCRPPGLVLLCRVELPPPPPPTRPHGRDALHSRDGSSLLPRASWPCMVAISTRLMAGYIHVAGAPSRRVPPGKDRHV